MSAFHPHVNERFRAIGLYGLHVVQPIINNIFTVDTSGFCFLFFVIFPHCNTGNTSMVPISVDRNHETISSHLIALVVFQWTACKTWLLSAHMVIWFSSQKNKEHIFCKCFFIFFLLLNGARNFSYFCNYWYKVWLLYSLNRIIHVIQAHVTPHYVSVCKMWQVSFFFFLFFVITKDVAGNET